MIASFSSEVIRRNSLVYWYIFFGCLHEASHLISASINGHSDGIIQYDGILPFMYRLFIGRYSIIPELVNHDFDQGNIVRHSGWIFSVIVALLICMFSQKKHNNAKIAACVTALEAITTDLFKWNALPGMCDPLLASRSAIFFCGNFGIIALHHLWFENQGKAALDVLEKMVNITMMRGAQSGGVVTFKPDNKHNLKGIRSRCVNSKRTDLSKLVRAKVQRDVFSKFGGNPFPKNSVTVMSGHTRFATSSKATMDGTHPHQWSPPSTRRVYDFSVPHNGKHEFIPKSINVENYITVS